MSRDENMEHERMEHERMEKVEMDHKSLAVAAHERLVATTTLLTTATEINSRQSSQSRDRNQDGGDPHLLFESDLGTALPLTTRVETYHYPQHLSLPLDNDDGERFLSLKPKPRCRHDYSFCRQEAAFFQNQVESCRTSQYVCCPLSDQEKNQTTPLPDQQILVPSKSSDQEEQGNNCRNILQTPPQLDRVSAFIPYPLFVHPPSPPRKRVPISKHFEHARLSRSFENNSESLDHPGECEYSSRRRAHVGRGVPLSRTFERKPHNKWILQAPNREHISPPRYTEEVVSPLLSTSVEQDIHSQSIVVVPNPSQVTHVARSEISRQQNHTSLLFCTTPPPIQHTLNLNV